MDTEGSRTAKLCLFARALHAKETDAVCRDEVAASLLGRSEYDRIHDTIGEGTPGGGRFDETQICGQVDCYLTPILMPRLAFAEEKLAEFAAEHGRVQYVILGAGMETFAFRNRNRDIRVFELDHPFTQRYKLRRIAELGWKIPDNVTYAPIDFAKDDLNDVLARAGYRADQPSFFSIMGVTYYLDLSVFRNTLRMIGRQAKPGARLVFDFPDETTFTAPGYTRAKQLSEIAAALGETMIRGFSLEEVRDALAENGLAVTTHLSPDDIQRRWFKDHTRLHAFDNVHLVLAERRCLQSGAQACSSHTT